MTEFSGPTGSRAESAAAQDIVIVGAGGHAKAVAAVADALGYHVLGFADLRAGADFFGRPVKLLGYWPADVPLAVAIGNAAHRCRLVGELASQGRTLPVLVHPRAVVDPSAALGRATVVMPGAVVGADARIGAGAIVNTGATVDHDCRLGDFVHVAPGAHLAGEVAVGEGSWIGIGAAIVQQTTIGAWTMVGAGAVVLGDLPNEVTAVGVPAKVIRQGRYG